jgi:hypothetical protein
MNKLARLGLWAVGLELGSPFSWGRLVSNKGLGVISQIRLERFLVDVVEGKNL